MSDKLVKNGNMSKNKWIIAHEQNTSLINRGVISGITGENFEIKY